MNTPHVRPPATAAVLLLTLLAASAAALPRFSLQSGQRCVSCHVNATGGGMRTESGWSVERAMGLYNPVKSPLAPLYEAEDNTLGTPELSWGFEYREQLAKRPEPGYRTPQRRVFGMQAMPYVSYRPVQGLELYATYNLFRPELPEQVRTMASISYAPVESFRVEAGEISPDFGILHDDHTVLTRVLFSMFRMWAELGGQAYFSPTDWLTVSGGVFSSTNRVNAMVVDDTGSALVVGKVVAQSAVNDDGYSVFGSVSTLLVGGERMFCGDVGIGYADRLTLLFELQQRAKRETHESETYGLKDVAYGIHANYEIMNGLAATVRYERADMQYGVGNNPVTTAYVGGAQIFPIPFLELRPEYRYTETKLGSVVKKDAQWTFQLHVFY